MAKRSRIPRNDPGLKLGWKESFGYAAVILLALTGGYFSARLLTPGIAANQQIPWLGLFWFCFSIFVLSVGVFHLRCILVDPDHKVPPDAGDSSWLADAVLAALGLMGAAVVCFLYFTPGHAYSLAPVAICIICVWGISHDEYSHLFLLPNKLENREKIPSEESGFISKVFFPALSMSSLSFLLGWYLCDATPNHALVLTLYCFYIIACAIGCVRESVSLPRTLLFVSAYPLACSITFSFQLFEGTFLNGYFDRPEFVFAAIWTYVMGVFEVSKRPYMLAEGQSPNDPDGKLKDLSNERDGKTKDLEFYEGGANWSMVTVCHLPLLLIFLVNSASLIWFSICTISAAFSWVFLVTDKRSKSARQFSVWGGFAIGFLYVLLGIGMFPLAPPAIGFQPMYGTLVTAIVALATIAFVMYPREFLRVGRDFSVKGSFTDTKNAVMLAMINIVVVVSIILVWAGATNAIYGSVNAFTQRKIDIVFTICGVEMVAVFLAYLWTQARRPRSGAGDEGVAS